MRIVFWGTSEFACFSLERIFKEGYEIPGVVTASEKQSGRGLKLKPSPVKITAEKFGLKIIEPTNPNTEDVYRQLKEFGVDVCVLAAYGFMIKSQLLSLPAGGFVNIHPSLLPKYRGAAPVQRAVINGEKVTGVTTFFMNEGMDAGDIILQTETAIDANETYEELQERLAQTGADIVIKTLDLIKSGNYKVQPQDKNKITLAPKIKKEDCLIDWNKPAITIHNLIRGLSREPGAHTHFREKRVGIFRSVIPSSDIIPDAATPGKIMVAKNNLLVATKDSYVQIVSLQMEAGKIITGTDFINGQRIQPDEYFK